jgi:hypothetical protein
VTGSSIVSPNACLSHAGSSGRSPDASLPPLPNQGKDVFEQAVFLHPAAPVVPGPRAVTVEVLDDKGAFIPDIPRGNFRVWEFGVVRPILEFQSSRPAGDSAAGRHDSASGYRISYQSSGEAALPAQITVELIDAVTKRPLPIKNEKGKSIRYHIVVTRQ